MSATDDFDAFYAARAAPLARALFLRTGDLTRAQDCTQEAFMRAWLKWSSIESGADPVGWVRTVAWNLAVNDWRRRRRERVRDAGIQPLQTRTDAAHMAEVLTLRAALAQLPESQQTAIVLHYFEDMSIPDISTMTGIPAGTIKSSLHRARAALRAQLADQTDPHPQTSASAHIAKGDA